MIFCSADPLAEVRQRVSAEALILPILRDFLTFSLTVQPLLPLILAHFTKLSKQNYKENLNFYLFIKKYLQKPKSVL